MAASSYDNKSMSLSWMLAIVVILYALASGAIAVSTAEDCGSYNAHKEWQLLPPHWECR